MSTKSADESPNRDNYTLDHTEIRLGERCGDCWCHGKSIANQSNAGGM